MPTIIGKDTQKKAAKKAAKKDQRPGNEYQPDRGRQCREYGPRGTPRACTATLNHAGDHMPYSTIGGTLLPGYEPWPNLNDGAAKAAPAKRVRTPEQRERDNQRRREARASLKAAGQKAAEQRAAFATGKFQYTPLNLYSSSSSYNPPSGYAPAPVVPAWKKAVTAAAGQVTGTPLQQGIILAGDKAGEAMKAVMGRKGEFGDKLEMALTAIGMVPEARSALDAYLTGQWTAGNALPAGTVGEVIIGGGVHAAIYCAARVAAGHPKPWVLERSGRPGGILAAAGGPSFWLNSRNQPGGLSEPVIGARPGTGLPVNDRGLNVLPGAPVQAAMLPGGEFQSDDDMAMVIRCALAAHANVVTGAAVRSVNPAPGGAYGVRIDDGRIIYARRVVDARGLGDPAADCDGKTILSFPQFMARMRQPFPMAGMGRVAVIGGGDAGKCAVEAILGIGPANLIAGMDYVPVIDWYAERLRSDYEGWRETERGRYQRIGSDLRKAGLEPQRRLRVLPERATATQSLGNVIVSERNYDTVITCTGWTRPAIYGLGPDGNTIPFAGQVQAVPVLASKQYQQEIYAIGPAANIGFSGREIFDGIASRPQNQVAIFRLAGRTAALATTLPRP